MQDFLVVARFLLNATDWLERPLTVDILRLMFKKLYTCLQFGAEKEGFFLVSTKTGLRCSFVKPGAKVPCLGWWQLWCVTVMEYKHLLYKGRWKTRPVRWISKLLELTEPKWFCIFYSVSILYHRTQFTIHVYLVAINILCH